MMINTEISGWCVVVTVGNTVIEVVGPFDSAQTANEWAKPKNETQKGAIVGIVFPIRMT
jgi:hypothetical protein